MSSSALLLLSLLATCLLLGVLVLVMARGERQSASLRLWGWGYIIYAAGMLAIIALFLPWDVRQVIGNSLISSSALLTSLAAYRHAHVRLHWSWLWGSLAAVVLLLTVNHLFLDRLIIDIATPTVYATLLYIGASWYLIRKPPPAAKAATRFFVFTILATLVVWNVRLAAIWISLGGTSDPGRADFAEAAFAIAQLLLIVASTVGLMWIEVRLMEEDLRRSAFTDLLTGLPNRRAMLLRFEEALARARRQHERFGIALFDLDHFKQINDTCGHFVGDRILQHIAAALDQGKRTEDVLGRIGGEEFLVLLPHHGREDSLTAAERLRKTVETAKPDREVAGPATTVSGGVAVYPDDGEDWDRLYMAADRRMYQAKRSGRNRVEGADSPA